MSVKLMMVASMVVGVLCSPEPKTYGLPPRYEYSPIPQCAKNTTKSWCLEDSEYPIVEVQDAINQHYQAVLNFYKDALVDTATSLDGIEEQVDEVYLCPSSTGYVQPLRAINVEGKWRTVVNHVESYGIKFTQSARIEECDIVIGSVCPLVASCYESKCVQKNVFHRFLVYDPYDYTFPFAIEKFKLPGSCGCVIGDFHL